MANRMGEFPELNPVAANLLHADGLLTAFKLATLSFASAIFIILRRHWLAEAACWLMCAVHVALALVWLHYFDNLL